MEKTQFYILLKLIAQDNGLKLKLQNNWFKFLDYAAIQKKLEPLSQTDLEVFANGEIKEMEIVLRNYDIEDISLLLNLIFDGELHTYFFE